MNFHNRDRVWIYLTGGALLLLTGYLYWTEYQTEWGAYQSDFREMVARRFGPERASQVEGGLRQVWVKELDRVDRCVTCHLGVEWKGLDSAAHPFRSHPKEILDKHPVARYGCTICHGGQGHAVDTAGAHATDIEHWESPLLGAELGKAYLLSDRKAMLQGNCNVCHRYERETKGAEYINYAKQLMRDKGCRACHIINGRGGVIGPNLNSIGDQSPEQYDYSRMSGGRRVFGWHMAHFKNPKSMVAGTIMPAFGFGSKESQALAMLVMSWKTSNLPPAYLPGAKPADVPAPEEREKEQRMMTGGGALFVRKMCFVCHDVSTLGIESASKIGPDLAIAWTDVQSRFGRTLEDFLKNPTGTMSVVLATQIHLSDAERAEIVDKLKGAYQQKVEQDAKARK